MSSTLQDVRDRTPPVGLVLRHIALVLLTAALLAGLLGFLGDDDRVETTTRGDYTLTLEYPRTTRAGLEEPWRLRVASASGFDQDVTIRVSTEYFAIYQFQGMTPVPAQETADAEYTYWTFTRPPGSELVIELDHLVQPGTWTGSSGSVALLEGTEAVASIDFTTTVFP